MSFVFDLDEIPLNTPLLLLTLKTERVVDLSILIPLGSE